MIRLNFDETLKKCESPGCVRCSMYDKVLTDATHRLEDMYQLETNNHDLQRIKNSLKKNIPTNSSQKPEVFYLNGLTVMPWWTSSFHFAGDVEKLENNFKMICEEFYKVNSNPCALWKVNNTPDGQWKVLHLVNQGKVQRNMVDLCPNTFNIVSSLPSVMTENVFANIAFSVIEPGTVITEHYGPTNIRLRCHLGLVTPKSCRLCVAGSCSQWRQGACLLFDDAHLHSVVHEGDQDQWRAVLIVDLWHPNVTRSERSIINKIFKLD
ncbi:aspartate beta-hydroxylase domain-containing protein 2-like [Ylistrum balloti]|uniref:aspartate beta-hydroxylase domain-containing protein 2-like n=1 Tax=Ylistrum balloti TaxID=509963 RepID=UPI002905C3E0|nr:aspartate beta-hydroxylase domain-containing protein 2-like [Ylistrum balloti]